MTDADEAESRLALFARSWTWQHGEEPGSDGAITDAIVPGGGYAALLWADICAIREDRKRLLAAQADAALDEVSRHGEEIGD